MPSKKRSQNGKQVDGRTQSVSNAPRTSIRRRPMCGIAMLQSWLLRVWIGTQAQSILGNIRVEEEPTPTSDSNGKNTVELLLGN